MTSGRTMIHGAAPSSIGMGVSMAASLVVGKVIATVMPQYEVAAYFFLILLSDLALLLHNFGLYQALPRQVAAADEPERGPLVRSTLGIQLAVSVVLGAVVFVAWRLIEDPAALSTDLTWRNAFPYLFFLPPFFIFATQRDTALGALAGMNRFRARTIALIAGALAQIALVVVLIGGLERGLKALLFATVISYGITVVALYAGLPRPRRPQFGWRHYRAAVSFSWPLYANNLLTFVSQRLDALIVGAILGPVAFAIYEMAKRLPAIITRFLSAALVPYLPGISARIAQGDLEGASRLMRRTLSLVAFIGYGGVFAVLTVEKPLIRLLFSDAYLPMTGVLWALLAGTCLAVQTGIAGQSILALGRPGVITLFGAGTAVISVIANLVFIPQLGMAGAGWAFLCAAAFSAIAQTGFVLRIGLTVPLLDLLKPHGLLAAGLILFWIGGGVWWAGLAGLIFFVAFSFAIGVVSLKEFREVFRALLPGARS